HSRHATASSVLHAAALTRPIYTLSLHDALPISNANLSRRQAWGKEQDRHLFAGVIGAGPGRIVAMIGSEDQQIVVAQRGDHLGQDRKSTRLNSSHVKISYAVFCLKKKKQDATWQ